MTPYARAFLLVGLLLAATLAFGAVYPPGFVPMLIVAAAVAADTLRRGTARACIPRELALGAAIWFASIGVQLVPIPRRLLVLISPHTDAFLRVQDLKYAGALAMGATGMSAPWHTLSIDPFKTMVGVAFVVVLVAVVFATAAIGGETLNAFAIGISGAGLVVALVGIVDVGAQDRLIYGLWSAPAHTTPFGPFINRNHFGGWMIMAIALTVAYAHAQAGSAPRLESRRGRDFVRWLSSAGGNRWLLATSTVAVMVLAVALTTSRSAITGVVLVLVATEWMASRTRLRARVVSALLLVVVIGLFSTAFDPILDRFTGDPLIAPRMPAWTDAATIIRHFPFLGTGWNTYGVATLLSESADANLPFHFDAAHSDYLQLVAEVGLIGTGVALFLVVAFGRQAMARAQRDTRETLAYWIRRGAIIGLIGIASQELVEFSLQIPANALLCALLCGLALHVPAGPMGPTREWSFLQLAAARRASRSTTVH